MNSLQYHGYTRYGTVPKKKYTYVPVHILVTGTVQQTLC
jgi:hypothetical protein